MYAEFLGDLSNRGMLALFGICVGSIVTWLFARWKRYQQRRSILRGDARDTVVIHHHLIEQPDSSSAAGSDTQPSATLRIRTVGQEELSRVVPNGHLAGELIRRAFHVTPHETLISMEGVEGSYLLETLTNFVCDRTSHSPNEHDLYVMAPCCEPAELAEHQPITILLVALKDLPLFESWTTCRRVMVEHGNDGARVLTLMEMARRFRTEQEKINSLRKAGQRTKHVETMYILDLALDKRSAHLPIKPVPWGRFESVLKEKNLE